MKIRFTILEEKNAPHATTLTTALRSAVSSGDMAAADAATEELLALTNDALAADLPEEEWRQFLSTVRTKEPDFQSDYLLPTNILHSLAAALPEPDFAALKTLFQTAQTVHAQILQLPFDGEEVPNV
jgi:hypothetical protein